MGGGNIRNLYLKAKIEVQDLVASVQQGKDPEVILIGEFHRDDNFKTEQAYIIEKYKPEFVLLESIGDHEPEVLEDVLQKYAQFPTINDWMRVLNSYGIKETGLDLWWYSASINKVANKMAASAKEFSKHIPEENHFGIEERINTLVEFHKDNPYAMENGRTLPKTYEDFLGSPLFRMDRLFLFEIEDYFSETIKKRLLESYEFQPKTEENFK